MVKGNCDFMSGGFFCNCEFTVSHNSDIQKSELQDVNNIEVRIVR